MERLKGSRPKGKAPYGFSTSGPKGWRGKSESHVADSKRGLKSEEPAPSVIHASNLPRSVVGVSRGVPDARNPGAGRKSSPHSTHIPGGAIDRPARATFDPASQKRGKR